ncbi:MAG: prolyl oligopeptidase family serine peptidase [Cyclobacteriaceae bacterium]
MAMLHPFFRIRWILPFLTSWLLSFMTLAQKDLNYQIPPQAMADLINAPLTPLVSVNNNHEWMVLLERSGYPPIEELAQPELRLAGLRINPRTNGASRGGHYTGMAIKPLDGSDPISVTGLPEAPKIENVSWSPDGQKIAFTLTQEEGIELWITDVNRQQAEKLTDAIVNDAMRGLPYAWLSGSKTIVYKSVVVDRGEEPQAALAPTGPVIQVTTGEKSPARTYQDLLQNAQDEALFTYYGTAQLQALDIETRESKPLGEPALFAEVSPSPDGNYVLVVKMHPPFSYLVPYYRFPMTVEAWDREGTLVQAIAEIPLAENIPIGFNAVEDGPRDFTWRHDQPATIYWVEAQDGGDPSREVDIRDQLFYWKAPFTEEKQASIPMKLRYGGITWGNDDLAIVSEWWWSNRQQITSAFDPEGEEASKRVLFDRSFEDRYNDPGTFETKVNEYGQSVLLTDELGEVLYLTGEGASSEGNRPFVDAFTLATKETERLWQSEAPYYESPVQLLNVAENTVLTRRESREEPPNYYIRNWKADKLTALTEFPHPFPALKNIEKQVVSYQREDGVALQGDLYLPEGYTPGDERLPVLMWAYPSEYKSADAASQVDGSPYEFIRIGWYSPLFWVTQGYAILDDPSMPVVGEGDEEPNDTFRKQLVANAKAAIDKLVDMDIADSSRIAIGGHSYGAFMTANLLAHSDLFAAGIARSGAYNRTLTPFGFQAEERTYWEAPEVYYQMSPFMHADKINEPILLIHGEADNNSGTFPLQSQRYFNALKGLGATARLVMLPHESHGYQAKESVLHMLWEMDQWLDTYVKNRNITETARQQEEE